MTIVIILTFALCIMAQEPDCLKQKYNLFARLSGDMIMLKFVGSKKLQISWDHLLDDASMECVEKVKLSDETGDLLESKEFRPESKDAAPFVQDFDMCKDHSKAFVVSFYIIIGDELARIDSQEVEIKSEDHDRKFSSYIL